LFVILSTVCSYILKIHLKKMKNFRLGFLTLAIWTVSATAQSKGKYYIRKVVVILSTYWSKNLQKCTFTKIHKIILLKQTIFRINHYTYVPIRDLLHVRRRKRVQLWLQIQCRRFEFAPALYRLRVWSIFFRQVQRHEWHWIDHPNTRGR